MSTAVTIPIAPPRRFTVRDYYRMAEEGILAPGERVELLNGEIIQMTPIGPDHGSVVDRLNQLFVTAFGRRAIVRVQGAVRLNDLSEPEPDLAVLRPRKDFYRSAHPGPDDVLFLVEVADTSLLKDRQIKVPLYAEAGIAEVWLIDLKTRSLTVHRKPTGRRFRQADRLTGRSHVSPAAFPEHDFTVRELVG